MLLFFYTCSITMKIIYYYKNKFYYFRIRLDLADKENIIQLVAGIAQTLFIRNGGLSLVWYSSYSMNRISFSGPCCKFVWFNSNGQFIVLKRISSRQHMPCQCLHKQAETIAESFSIIKSIQSRMLDKQIFRPIA